jgi:uncharacterized protein (DUF885 family)
MRTPLRLASPVALLLVAACGAAPATPLASPSSAAQATAPAPIAPTKTRPAWIERSDDDTRILIDVATEFAPEGMSRVGVESADEKTTDLGDGFRARHVAALKDAKAKLEARKAAETDPLVAQDLAILVQAADLDLRDIDVNDRNLVPHHDVARIVFSGIHGLLDDQVPPARRIRAVARLRRYAGMVAGVPPLADMARADVMAKLAQPGLVAPARLDVEKSLSTSAQLRDGIAKLFQKYAIAGYEEPLRVLTQQLAAYDDFLRTTVLARARADFALPPPVYAVGLEEYGVDMPPADLAAKAHQMFGEIQAEMQPVAAKIAQQRGLPSSDYREVIRALKKDQLAGDAILPHYKQRLADIEGIIRREHLVTLPDRPARIRLGTPAESAAQPAPHMMPPRLIGNTGEQGEFVLPLAISAPSGSKEAEVKYDDFTYAAASWTLTAHEARPGHELQFDSMVERGISLARALFAFNSANVEGWGLYSEYITLPFMPPEGQLASLLLRLQRAARAFLDPELQQGKWTFDSARDFMEKEVVLSHAFATEEVERFTFRAPGQATSYLYGFIRLLALRREVEQKLGAKFNAQTFHDEILSEGLLPPDLMRKAVLAKLGAG